MLLAFCYGACTSLQYTSMNTLAYADIAEADASNASSIASTAQQLSISFGVAIAGLTTAVFVPVSARLHAGAMVEGIHRAFLFLGILTVFSTLVFRAIKAGDGGDVSHQRSIHPGG